MDNAQAGDPAAGSADSGGDWRSQLQPEVRGRIVNEITETLKKHLPVSVPEGLMELQKIAEQFEEKIYTGATSQSDYLRKISLKVLSMESQAQNKINTQGNPQNGQVVQNQRPHNLASEHSTAQTGCPGAGDWQEELYQKIKALKNQYLLELSNLHNKIYVKLQLIDNHMPDRKLTEQYEKMKSFKLVVERTMWFLQIDKTSIQLALKDKISVYERHIVAIINSQKRKPSVQTFQQSAGQSPRSNTSRLPVDSTAPTDYSAAGDWQEESYQMNKTLKNQYQAGLSDLYEISTKLNDDSHMASQKPIEHYEKMKNFKLMLESSLNSLQIGKGSVQLAHEENIPMHKRQIISILDSEGWKPEETAELSAGQAPITNPSKKPCYRE